MADPKLLDEGKVKPLLTLQQGLDEMEAMGLPRKTEVTLMNWIRRYKIGFKLAGEWVLYEDRFAAFLRGEQYQEEKDA